MLKKNIFSLALTFSFGLFAYEAGGTPSEKYVQSEVSCLQEEPQENLLKVYEEVSEKESDTSALKKPVYEEKKQKSVLEETLNEEKIEKELSFVESPNAYYTVKNVLGNGAFGKVYEVVDEAGNRYALKEYFIDNRIDIKYYTDSEREYKRGQVFDHTNIIKSFEVFSALNADLDERKYLVLEFVEGKRFSDIKRKTLKPAQSLELCLQFVDAVRYAFDLGFFHEDLHYNNLMLSDSSEIKIIDLASFFSVQEVEEYIRRHDSSEDSSKESEEREENKEQLATEADDLDDSLDETKISLEAKEVRKKPLKGFRNPVLANLVKDVKQKRALDPKLAKKPFTLNSVEMMPWLAYYFDRVSSICIYLVNRSSLSKSEKLDLYTSIKRLSWGYKEDSYDEFFVPAQFYFDQLAEIFILASESQ